MGKIKRFNEHQESLEDIYDKYSVISKWTELDGSEQWDVVYVGPVSYQEALKIARKATKTWNDSESLLHHIEIPIKYDKLQDLLSEEEEKE